MLALRPTFSESWYRVVGDLKTSNNSVYDVTRGGGVERWYVVRDLGTSLGATNRFNPMPNRPEKFEQKRFVTGVRNGFVEFGDYDAVHSDLVDRRISLDDVRWATQLLARLSERQWTDAFRGAGYTPELTGRYVQRILQKIGEGRALAQKAEMRVREPELRFRRRSDLPMAGVKTSGDVGAIDARVPTSLDLLLSRRAEPSPPLILSNASESSPG